MDITLAPCARYMIVCDDVLQDGQGQGKLLIVGLTTLVKWPEDAGNSVVLRQLVVLLILTDGYGTGMGQIVCYDDETGAPVFGSSPRRISFEGTNPSGYYGVTFKLLEPRFASKGIYLVKFLFNDIPVAEQIITVR